LHQGVLCLLSVFTGAVHYLRRTFDFGSRNGFNLLVDIAVKGRDETCHFTINSERHAVRESRFYSYWGTYCFSFMKELVNGGENW
ncbi:hypothetical protein, partial [Neglectibacter timonensis]|uniref:hypothetical protein n=1 Tax=Neglectibacter timonensis TaxID=1776382 RepID=UPI0039917B0C